MDRGTDFGPAPTTPEAKLLQDGFRYALSLTHHRQDAEDLTHEAWVNLCRRYGCVGSHAVLFTAIRNLFVDRCRRAKVVVFDPVGEDRPEIADPDLLEPGTLVDVEQLLGTLRPGEREAIYLHYVEGHTAAEIGIVTRQARGTVLSLLHRALKKLRLAASQSG